MKEFWAFDCVLLLLQAPEDLRGFQADCKLLFDYAHKNNSLSAYIVLICSDAVANGLQRAKLQKTFTLVEQFNAADFSARPSSVARYIRALCQLSAGDARCYPAYASLHRQLAYGVLPSRAAEACLTAAQRQFRYLADGLIYADIAQEPGQHEETGMRLGSVLQPADVDYVFQARDAGGGGRCLVVATPLRIVVLEFRSSGRLCLHGVCDLGSYKVDMERRILVLRNVLLHDFTQAAEVRLVARDLHKF